MNFYEKIIKSLVHFNEINESEISQLNYELSIMILESIVWSLIHLSSYPPHLFNENDVLYYKSNLASILSINFSSYLEVKGVLLLFYSFMFEEEKVFIIIIT